MTAEEKLSISKRLRSEVTDAEDTLAYTREKALQYTQQLREVIQTIEASCKLEPSREDFDMDATRPELRLSPEYQGALNYTTAITLISNLKFARQALFNVQQRRARMATHL